jgi:hypothetical protein
MRKLYFLLAIPLFLNSCSDDVPEVANPATAAPVSAVPDHFIQKVMIESFTQTYCGQCPASHLLIDSLINYNPGRVYNISYHIEDAMTDNELVQSFSGRHYFDSLYNPSFIYPSGIINRNATNPANITPDYWIQGTFVELSKIPSCGIAIEAEQIEGSTLNLKVHVGFSAQMFGEYRIHTYLVNNVVQNSDPSFDQLNDFSSQGSTPDSLLPLYDLNDTIHMYNHKYVMRKVLTHTFLNGDPIPSSQMVKGNDFVTAYSVDLSGIDYSKASILVFVDKYGLTIAGHRVENVQLVPIGDSKDWN